jgi:hypothetical protein
VSHIDSQSVVGSANLAACWAIDLGWELNHVCHGFGRATALASAAILRLDVSEMSASRSETSTPAQNYSFAVAFTLNRPPGLPIMVDSSASEVGLDAFSVAIEQIVYTNAKGDISPRS